jgi:hypothetical protein
VTAEEDFMRRLTLVLVVAASSGLILACGGGGGGSENSMIPGQTDFVNNEPGDNYGGRGDGEWNGVPGHSAGAADGDSSKAAPPAAPPQGRTGEVEEGDIYKIENNLLFYLNTYRGFIVYDFKDPKNPVQISRLPVYGYPIEMFIQKNTVYALLRDALYLTQVKGKLQFKRHNTSQLVAIDISDLKNPKVLQTVDIIGQLREGVSRKIEDTIYVVSYRDRYYYYDWSYNSANQQKEQAWVYSFNVADPKNLQLVDQLMVFEGGGFNYHDPNYKTSVYRYFSGVTISATSNALMVAENWYTHGWVSGSKWNCGSSTNQQQAMLTIIDISDPKGKIRTHTKFETAGFIGDQFKMTYVYSDKTKVGTFFGIVARREWTSANCQGSSLIQNTLEAWDVTDGAAPKKSSEVSFGKPNETVRGSTFDADRGAAFAITAQAIDPLYAIDISDPKALKIRSLVDGLSGDMNVFRFIADKKFLIAIGRDNSKTCTGFSDPAGGWQSAGVAVSIIDVQDLDKIRLVQRKCVAVKNAGWVNSELNWNLDQAHKMIGMHSDGKVNAITVPVYYYKKSGDNDWWWYGYETAVGLMSWDLTKYDPSQSELNQKVLENHGTIIHPKGQVRRTIVFTHKGASDRRMVMNLSNTHVGLVDIENLAAPVTQSIVEIAPFHSQLFRFGDYMVEHVRPGAYSYYDYYGSNGENASEFRVKKISSGVKLEDAPALASYTVGQVERVLKYKDNLVLFRRAFVKDPNGKNSWSGTWESDIVVLSFANPTKPTKMGGVKLPSQLMPYYYYWCGMAGYWGGYWFGGQSSNNWIVADSGIVFLSSQYSYDYATKTSTYSRKLVAVDLSNLAQPTVKEHLLTNAPTWAFYGLVPDPTDAKSFYLTYRTKVGQLFINGSTFTQFKYYAQRWAWNGSDWQGDYAINLPGQLMKAWTVGGQKLLLTYDYTYNPVPSGSKGYPYQTWQSSFRLNLLRELKLFGAPVAELLDFHNFQSYYHKDVVVDGAKMFVNARHDYYWNQANQVKWEDQSDSLMIFDLSGLKLKKTYSEPTGTYSVQMMGTHNGQLFINIPGDGILVVDVANLAAPEGKSFMRTLGYTTHIEFDDATSQAFLASGYFGIYQLSLADKTSQIPII